MKTDIKQYDMLQKMYDYFNINLFNNSLPEVIIILDYKKNKNTLGYFHFEKMGIDEEKNISVISLNPNYFNGDNLKNLSTLVHEMCHAWEYYHNKMLNPDDYLSKVKPYHSKKWGKKMEEIGLIPSSTGLPGGKKTGVKMSDYIDKGGLFEEVAINYLNENFPNWENENIFLFFGKTQIEIKKKRKKRKFKYTCPECGETIKGKLGLSVTCNECDKNFEFDDEEPEPEDDE